MELQGDTRAFHDYMAVERHLSPRTAIEYCRDVIRFQAVLAIDGKVLNKAKTKRIRSWITGLMADGSNKPQSVHRKIAALHAYYKWLVRERVRSDNPVDAIERPKCEKRLPVCMTVAETNQFLATRVKRRFPILELRDDAMRELMYGSGLRRAEVCGIDLGDIDFESRMMLVIGKGNKQRAVFLTEDAIAAVRAYVAARGTVEPRSALFVTTRGTRLTTRQLWVLFKNIRDKAALTKHVTPHVLRHSFATHMHEAGADLMTIKELLGHESVSTTQIYTNVSPEHMRKVFERTHPRAKAS